MKYGAPRNPAGRPSRPPLERFMGHMVPEPNTGCWLWLSGYDRDGYAMFFHTRRGNSPRATRFIYQELVGPIPKGLVLDHLCRNRGCVNPAHLEPVTNRENIMRGHLPWRDRTHCARGHEFTPANTYHHPGSSPGSRKCRACHADYERARRARLRGERIAAT